MQLFKDEITISFSFTAQYAAAAHVPLIKSPSLRIPPPVSGDWFHLGPPLKNAQVTAPADIQPLPDDINAYVCKFS